MDKLDIYLFSLVNSLAGVNVVLDAAAIVAAETFPYLFCLFLLYLWFTTKIDDGKHIALRAFETAVLGLSINFLISALWFHPRPFMTGIGTQLVPHAPETSFPSDHATFMFCVACALWAAPSIRKYRIPAMTLAFVGGLSRVFCGIHFPFDVVGSFAVALASAALVGRFTSDGGCLAKFNDFCVEVARRCVSKLGFRSISGNIKYHIRLAMLVVKDPRTPRAPKIILGLAAAYALSPIDLIPDFIPVIGQLDDAVVIPLLIYVAYKLVPSEIIEDCRLLAVSDETPSAETESN